MESVRAMTPYLCLHWCAVSGAGQLASWCAVARFARAVAVGSSCEVDVEFNSVRACQGAVANTRASSAKALNSSAFPLGSTMKNVDCSPASPAKRVFGAMRNG